MRRFEGTSRRLLLAGSVGAVALLGGHAAFAADAEVRDNAATTTVEEVVVTAEKRTQNIQLVPASVSAISGDKLNDLGLKSLNDFSQYVPGLVIATGGSPGQTSVTLRGIAPVGPGSVVGYYLDDTPLGSSGNYARSTIFALDLMPYDVERFEVLRGPQGTLYGAGAMGGLIKYVLKQADTNAFSAQVGGELDSIKNSGSLGYGVRAAVNLPVVTDKLAIRASFYDQQNQGFTDNARLGTEGADDNRQLGGRVAVTWKPAENVRVNLNAFISRLDSDDNASVRLTNLVGHTGPGGSLYYTGHATYGELSHSTAYAQPFTKDIDYYSGTLNWDLGPATFTSATSWSKTKTHQIQDSTDVYGAYTQLFGLAPGVAFFDLNLELKKFTQEFRLASPTGGKVEWLAGAFYTDEKSVNEQLVDVFDGNYQPITGPFAGFFSPFFAYAKLPSTFREYAAFGDVTVNFTDKLNLTGGLRYAHNSQDFRQISDGLVLGGFTDNPGSSSEGVVTWSVSSRYRITEETMVYGKIATGYRPGGPNVVLPGVPGVSPTVDSDKLTSYEAGIKSTFLQGRAQINLTAFDVQWKGIQLGVLNPAGTASFLANAGDAYSRGLELEGYFVPVAGLRLGYNAAYTKTKLTSLLPSVPTPFVLGAPLPGVPTWTAGMTADYSWNLSGDWEGNVGGGVRYVGKEWASSLTAGPGANPTYQNPDYMTVDLHAGVSNERFKISVFARNLADERVYLQGNIVTSPIFGNDYAIDTTVLQPRTIGISIDAKF